MNSALAACVIGFIIAFLLAVMRSRDDADKGTGAYIVKVLIIVVPIVYLSLTYLGQNDMAGGSSSSGLDMRTGYPDF